MQIHSTLLMPSYVLPTMVLGMAFTMAVNAVDEVITCDSMAKSVGNVSSIQLERPSVQQTIISVIIFFILL